MRSIFFPSSYHSSWKWGQGRTVEGDLTSLLCEGKKQKSLRHLQMRPSTPRLSFANIGLRGEVSPGCAAGDRADSTWGGRAGKLQTMETTEKCGFHRGQGLCTTLVSLDVGPEEAGHEGLVPEELEWGLCVPLTTKRTEPPSWAGTSLALLCGWHLSCTRMMGESNQGSGAASHTGSWESELLWASY